MTKRRYEIPQDLQNLATANANFKAAYDAMGALQARIVAEPDEDLAEEMTATYATFLMAAKSLYEQSNAIIKIANADARHERRPVPAIEVPERPGLILP